MDRRQFVRRQCGTNQALGTESANAQVRANAAEQDGIGQNVDAEEIDQDGGMAEPGGGDGILVPGLGFRDGCWLLNWAAGFGYETADNPRTELVR